MERAEQRVATTGAIEARQQPRAGKRSGLHGSANLDVVGKVMADQLPVDGAFERSVYMPVLGAVVGSVECSAGEEWAYAAIKWKEMQMRVLFADDQIPSSIDAENEICKQELRKELLGKLPNFDSAYQEDYQWFTHLVHYLSVDMGFTLTKARSFAMAMELAQKRDDYDVAVIDLSWTGDPGIAPGDKKNSGLKILRMIADDNKAAGKCKPTIAFSQNYQHDPSLFASVLETDALPIPKDYTQTGLRSVGAAIKLMGMRIDSGKSGARTKWDQISIAEIIKSLTVPQVWALIVTIVGALATVATSAFCIGLQIGSRLKTPAETHARWFPTQNTGGLQAQYRITPAFPSDSKSHERTASVTES